MKTEADVLIVLSDGTTEFMGSIYFSPANIPQRIQLIPGNGKSYEYKLDTVAEIE